MDRSSAAAWTSNPPVHKVGRTSHGTVRHIRSLYWQPAVSRLHRTAAAIILPAALCEHVKGRNRRAYHRSPIRRSFIGSKSYRRRYLPPGTVGEHCGLAQSHLRTTVVSRPDSS